MKIKLLALASLLSVSGASFALTSDANLTVTAEVSSSCVLDDATLNFSTYDPTSPTPTEASTMLNIVCSNNTPYTIGFSGAQFKMTRVGGGGELFYSLTDDAEGVAWNGSHSIVGMGNGNPMSHPVSGAIVPGQFQQGGAYSEVAIMRVTY